jgi:hypothetical protein
VMAAGSLLIALGCALLAASHTLATYYLAWACLGLAMRLTLYDAAFAALARIGGPAAGRAMSQITLLGGLASTTFWPIGHALALRLGWRGALLSYAAFALATIPLHLAIPGSRAAEPRAGGAAHRAPLTEAPRDRWVAASLYAAVLTLVAFLNAAMSAHMIGILAGFGMTASASVWIATLRGVGQSLGRLAEILSGSRLHPLRLNLVASLVLPVAFAVGLWSGPLVAGAVTFAFLYGAGNGISTIARGTLPLVLFDHRTYGAVVGRLLVPSYVASAVAPFAYALVIERWGEAGAMHLSLAVSATALAAALMLEVRFGARRARTPQERGAP